MFGREREMTLFCGEQVIPCHEHGVELDGFHEERTEEVSLTEDRRERSASPSEDRDEEEEKQRVKQNKNREKL